MEDDYAQSELGRQEAQTGSVNLHVNATPQPELTFYAYLSHSDAQVQHAGSQNFSTADWLTRSRDLNDGAGLGVEHRALLPKLTLGLDYQFNQSEARNQTQRHAFPNATSRLHGVQLSSRYHWRPAVDWILRYRYERYEESDWQNLGIGDLPNVLANPEGDLNTVNQLLSLAVSYRF